MKIQVTGLPTILLVVFVILKLMHYIEWSWTWVLSPLWLPMLVAIGTWFVVIMASVVVDFFPKP